MVFWCCKGTARRKRADLAWCRTQSVSRVTLWLWRLRLSSCVRLLCVTMSVHTSLIGALWGPVSQGILVNLEQRALFGCRVLSSLTAAPQLPAPEHTGQRRRLWVGPGWQPVTAHEEPGPSPRVAAARLSCWPVDVPGHCLATSAVAAEQAAAQRLYSSERFADDHFDRYAGRKRHTNGARCQCLRVFRALTTEKPAEHPSLCTASECTRLQVSSNVHRRHYRVNTGIFSRALQVFEPDGTSKIMSRCVRAHTHTHTHSSL